VVTVKYFSYNSTCYSSICYSRNSDICNCYRWKATFETATVVNATVVTNSDITAEVVNLTLNIATVETDKVANATVFHATGLSFYNCNFLTDNTVEIY